MVVLSASGVNKSYGVNTILRDITFSVNEGDKIGVLGVNGAGKTTLFRLITGEEQPDEGELYISKQSGVAYMHQHAEYSSDKTAREEVLSVFAKLEDQERRLAEIERMLEEESSDELISKYNSLQESFIDGGGMTFRARAASALMGLGFAESEIDLPLSQISGGQRTRVLIAKLLLGEAKILLLDEPTNHLDVKAISWMEDFLREYRGTVLVISHDRFFLDRVTGRTFEIENTALKAYSGNYSYYVKKKSEDRAAAEKLYELKKKEIDRIEGIIEQQKRFNQARNYITIKSKQKSIDRLESTLIKPEDEPEEIKFSFKSLHGAGSDILIAEGISKSFEQKSLISNVNMHIKRGEHVFLLGDNGTGKTTVMRMIMNEIMPDAGEIELGARVITGYFDQAQSDMLPQGSVLDVVYDAMPQMNLGQIRGALAAFLFKGDDVYKNVADLSGGERARVALCRLMLSKCNFLLMDEPTNHLDIPSKEALEKALSEYDGTLLMISHDRYFINKLADKIYAVENGTVRLYNGNYDYYITHREDSKSILSAKRPEKKQNEYQRRKEAESEKRKLRTRFERAEKSILDIEEEISGLECEMSRPEVSADYQKLSEISAELEKKRRLLSGLYKEWEELSEAVEVQ